MKLLLLTILAPFLFSAENAETLRRRQEDAALKCKLAEGRIFDFVEGLDRSCTGDQDCKAEYIGGDSCAAPPIFSKKALIKKDELLKLQANLREGCAELWKNRPACSPSPAFPKCFNGKCVDERELPPPPVKEFDKKLLNTPLKYALVRYSCAPHDGPAISITLSSEKMTCAQSFSKSSVSLSVQVWQNNFVSMPSVGDWGIAEGQGHVSFCGGGSCELLKSLRIRVFDIQKGKHMRGRIEADGIAPREFDAEWCESQGFCG